MSTRFASVFRAVTVAAACATSTSSQALPLIPPGNLAQASQVASPATCKALVDWMAVLERELAPTNVMTITLDRIGLQATNLFRDELFRPLYGTRISETSFEEMQNFYRQMFPMCGQHVSGEDLAKFQRMNILVSQPFRSLNGPFSFNEVVAGVAEREKIIAWMRMQTVSQPAATADALADLGRQMARAKVDLPKLWPREQAGFIDMLAGRQREVARTMPAPTPPPSPARAAEPRSPPIPAETPRPAGLDTQLLENLYAARFNAIGGALEDKLALSAIVAAFTSSDCKVKGLDVDAPTLLRYMSYWNNDLKAQLSIGLSPLHPLHSRTLQTLATRGGCSGEWSQTTMRNLFRLLDQRTR